MQAQHILLAVAVVTLPASPETTRADTLPWRPIPIKISSPDPYPSADRPATLFQRKIRHKGALDLCVHITYLHLPPGDGLVIAGNLRPGAPRLVTNEDFDRAGGPLWFCAPPGDEVTIALQLSSARPAPTSAFGFAIDAYAPHETPAQLGGKAAAPAVESTGICGGPTPDHVAARCVASAKYVQSRRVGSLRFSDAEGTHFCSGFLVDPGGAFLTAAHCFCGGVPSNAEVVFDLEASALFLPEGCVGAALAEQVVYPVRSVLARHDAFDTLLLQLDGAPGATYGCLSLDDRVEIPPQPMYVAHHPYGTPRAITAQESTTPSGRCESAVSTIGLGETTVCETSTQLRDATVEFKCDVQLGSSGAPLLSDSGNVVALIRGAGCPEQNNTSVAATWLLKTLAGSINNRACGAQCNGAQQVAASHFPDPYSGGGDYIEPSPYTRPVWNGSVFAVLSSAEPFPDARLLRFDTRGHLLGDSLVTWSWQDGGTYFPTERPVLASSPDTHAVVVPAAVYDPDTADVVRTDVFFQALDQGGFPSGPERLLSTQPGGLVTNLELLWTGSEFALLSVRGPQFSDTTNRRRLLLTRFDRLGNVIAETAITDEHDGIDGHLVWVGDKYALYWRSLDVDIGVRQWVSRINRLGVATSNVSLSSFTDYWQDVYSALWTGSEFALAHMSWDPNAQLHASWRLSKVSLDGQLLAEAQIPQNGVPEWTGSEFLVAFSTTATGPTDSGPHVFLQRFSIDGAALGSPTPIAGGEAGVYPYATVRFATWAAGQLAVIREHSATLNLPPWNLISLFSVVGCCADDDGDGDTECDAAWDCDDAHASVYPGAPEVCDGLNDNCLNPSWPMIPVQERDADGDGFSPCAGDCDDTRVSVFPAAPERNDGVDNQCPGDHGFGLIDDISDSLSFPISSDKTHLFWTAQPDATGYQVIRANEPRALGDCTCVPASTADLLDSSIPTAGSAFFYIVRASSPSKGSWGTGSAGERAGGCYQTACPF